MEKIALKNIFLLNWYGFIKKTIPIDEDLTFITGENESGKSTILDAFKFAFLGERKFNASAGNAKRDLVSYTRCLTDPSTQKYARSVKDVPTVYTHIALEFQDQLNQQNFILGVIVETPSTNITETTRYILKNKKLEELSFTYFEDGNEKVYSVEKFTETYQPLCYSQVNEGLDQFMAMLNLRLEKNSRNNYRNDYRRRLQNMMTYKAESKIPEFIKKFVLEAKEVDLKKLKASKNNIDQINKDFDNIKNELDLLNQILSDFNELDALSKSLVSDKVKEVYAHILNLKHQIENNQNSFASNESQIQSLSKYISDLDQEMNELNKAETQLETQLESVNGAQALEDEKKRKEDLQKKSEELKIQTEELHRFQEILNHKLNHDLLKEYVETNSEQANLLYNLENKNACGKKEYAVNTLKSYLNETKESLIERKGQLNGPLYEINQEISKLDQRIERLNRNQFDYSQIKNQVSLRQEIQRELKKKRIHADVKFAFEYVLKVKNPDWQKAIEAYLGKHRYAILVEPNGFDLANALLDRSSLKNNVELVRTKALHEKTINVVEDAVINQLEIENEMAKKYFGFFLGKIHAVKKSEVHQYDSAMSKEGKLSRNMAVSYMNLSKVKEYCLGQDAIQLTKENLKLQRNQLKIKENEFIKEKMEIEKRLDEINEFLSCFKDYNYDASISYSNTLKLIKESTKQIEKLEEALEDNREYQILRERIKDFEKKKDKLEKTKSNGMEKKSDFRSENNRLRESIEKNQLDLKKWNEGLENLNFENPTLVKEVVQECENYTHQTIQKSLRPKKQQEEDKEKKIRLEMKIKDHQEKYNENRREEDQLKIGLNYEASYRLRKNRIEMDDFEKVHIKLKEQMNKYEGIFKNDFCTEIYSNVDNALKSIRDINRELNKLNFSTRYQFRITLRKDQSDYAKILDYAKYLKDTVGYDNGQRTLDGIYGYSMDEMDQLNEDMKEIMERISSSKEDEEEILKLSDYRNYLDYEIEINNESIQNGKLSKQIRFDSGAATQIPYILILSASLSMFYNSRSNSARLIFIDEPFEKMSDLNIKKMLNFFKEQNFQVILCAPTNRMDSIGTECDIIVPVIKDSKENMLIGKEIIKKRHHGL